MNAAQEFKLSRILSLKKFEMHNSKKPTSLSQVLNSSLSQKKKKRKGKPSKQHKTTLYIWFFKMCSKFNEKYLKPQDLFGSLLAICIKTTPKHREDFGQGSFPVTAVKHRIEQQCRRVTTLPFLQWSHHSGYFPKNSKLYLTSSTPKIHSVSSYATLLLYVSRDAVQYFFWCYLSTK